jgi:Domain of unknown function (DUF4145)
VSDRAKFLQDALRCYENGDGIGLLDLANDFWIDVTADEVQGLSKEDNLILNEMSGKLRDAHGQRLHSKRLTLSGEKSPDNAETVLLGHINKLSPHGREIMMRAFADVAGHMPSPGTPAREKAEVDALDARYAKEVVDLLPRVIAKASTLQDLDVKRVPLSGVQRYFDEAHQCYFFGLNTACAVLCRAIIEAALKDVVGANNTFHELLELARSKLDPERINAAHTVHSAGNLAVHAQERFNKKYSDAAVERLITDTRKVLEDLYAAP